MKLLSPVWISTIILVILSFNNITRANNTNDTTFTAVTATTEPIGLYTPDKTIGLSDDSLALLEKRPLGTRIYENKYVQMTYVGVPLVAIGFATQGYVADRFKDLRDAFTPTYHQPIDDYLQYAPAAALLVIKACGVKGRSSWGRMIVSDAFSAALMAVTVNGLKYSVKTMRPDGSARNSFPSGHTATAFMAAHMLHKEYGCVSPWISVGGYATATFVGISRILNNRHWISDVLAGAGIGILSVEFGYLFADLIFKEKGLYQWTNPDFTIPERPSNIELSLGLVLPANSIDLGNGQRLSTATGSRIGIEGAWFANRYVGIGGEAAVSQVPVALESNTDELLHPISSATMAVGGYGSCPLGSRFRATLKTMVGCNIMSTTQLMPDALSLDKAGFYYEIGASISAVARRHFGVKAFCDYSGQTITTHYISDRGTLQAKKYDKNSLLHTATIGLSAAILF